MAYWAYVRPDTEITDIKAECDLSDQTMFAVVDSKQVYHGYITMNDIKSHPEAETAGDVLKSVGIRNRDVYVFDTDSVETAKRKLRQKKLDFIPVIDYKRHYQGTIDSDST